MGRMRPKTVNKSSRQVIERYYSRMTLDLHTNKKVLEEVALIPSKRLGNKIAGFSTHLMKRIQKGPVRGISLDMLAALGINDIPGLLQAHPVPVQHHHLLGFGRGAPRRY